MFLHSHMHFKKGERFFFTCSHFYPVYFLPTLLSTLITSLNLYLLERHFLEHGIYRNITLIPSVIFVCISMRKYMCTHINPHLPLDWVSVFCTPCAKLAGLWASGTLPSLHPSCHWTRELLTHAPLSDFYMGSSESNLGPHACTVSTLCTGPTWFFSLQIG